MSYSFIHRELPAWSRFSIPTGRTQTGPLPQQSVTAAPRCARCKRGLQEEDKKRTAEFWKNCKSCRDYKTASNRKRKAYINAAQDLLASFSSPSTSNKRPCHDTLNERSLNTTNSIATRECTVCASESSTSQFPSLEACSHIPDVCSECFLTWLDHQMASTTWEACRCPSSGCESVMTHDDVKKNGSAEHFAHFDELSMRSFLSSEPDFLYCSRPACTSGQIHDSTTSGPIFRCNACEYRVCTDHEPHVPFHEDETCDAYRHRIAAEQAEELRRRQEQEEASAAAVKESAVECPGCGAMISKTDGCDHMTCRRRGCGFEFCYVCRAPYGGATGIWRAGNTAHAAFCMYNSQRLPNYEPRPEDAVVDGNDTDATIEDELPDALFPDPDDLEDVELAPLSIPMLGPGFQFLRRNVPRNNDLPIDLTADLDESV